MLVLIGTTDVIFAVDSIPAIFAITSDPFIVLTANIFAILGLRALYFLLADLANRFHLLAYGLALVLVFIGAKMLMIDFYKIPIGYALLVTASLIAGSIILSLRSSGESAQACCFVSPQRLKGAHRGFARISHVVHVGGPADRYRDGPQCGQRIA